MKKAIALASLLAVSVGALAQAETIQKGPLRIAFDGQITPQRLPRAGMAPVKVAVGTKIFATQGRSLPQLRRIAIAINRHGRLDSTGLPVCEVDDIQPATTEKALEACRGSLVGEGHFAAEVSLSRQASFPSEGRLYAFNGTYEGRPAILAHVYGTQPVPISRAKGTFATTLTATFPATDDNLVTAIDLTLSRSFAYKDKRRSYASAGCPAPKGFPGATFPFAKASYEFAGGKKLDSTLTRSCRARG